MKSFTHVSSSQIDTYELCPTKWWLTKILGLVVPQHPSAALGSQIHATVEKAIEGGPEDEAQVHYFAKHHLPLIRELRGNVFVEKSFERLLRNGVKMVGKIDVLDLKLRPVPRVIDWKSIGDQQYAKTEEELASNSQLLIYAHEAYCASKAPSEIIVAHATCPTKKGIHQGTYREATVTAKDIHEHWTRVQDVVDEMSATALITDVTKVPHNKSACRAFGGCPFQSRCQALWGTTSSDPYASFDSPTDAPTASFTPGTHMDLSTLDRLFPNKGAAYEAALAKINALNAGKGIGAPEAGNPRTEPVAPVKPPVTVVDAPPPVPVTELTFENEDEKIAYLIGKGWSADDVSIMFEDDFNACIENQWAFADVVVERAANGDIISIAPKPPPAPVVEPLVETPRRRRAADQPVVTEATPAPAPTPEPEVVAETPKRRGRPPGSKNKPVDPATVTTPYVVETPAAADATPNVVGLVDRTQSTDPTPDVAVQTYTPSQIEDIRNVNAALVKENYDLAQKAKVLEVELAAAVKTLAGFEAAPTPQVSSASPTFVLYIDCFPEAGVGVVKFLDTEVAPFMRLAAENYMDEKTGKVTPVAHYLSIPYGKGPGMVAAYVTRYATDVAKGNLVVDTRSPCAAAVLEVLRPLADVVVRGGR